MGRLAVLLTVAILGAADADAHRPASVARTSVKIQLITHPARTRESHTQKFLLACSPPRGTLPLAARICEDIKRHPRAMLRPFEPRSVCGGSPFMPELIVTTRAGGSSTIFRGSPFCTWPHAARGLG